MKSPLKQAQARDAGDWRDRRFGLSVGREHPVNLMREIASAGVDERRDVVVADTPAVRNC